MVNNDPPDPRSGASEEPLLPHEALRRLEERLERVSNVAERLISQAADPSSPRSARKPPPAGWQPPEADDKSADARGGGYLELLLGALQSLRELMPPDIERRLAEALREVLLALRALIDWYLERSGHQRGGSNEV